MQAGIKIAQVWKAGREAKHIDLVHNCGMALANFVYGEVIVVGDTLEVGTVVSDGYVFKGRRRKFRGGDMFQKREVRNVSFEFEEHGGERWDIVDETWRRVALERMGQRTAERERFVPQLIREGDQNGIWAVRLNLNLAQSGSRLRSVLPSEKKIQSARSAGLFARDREM